MTICIKLINTEEKEEVEEESEEKKQREERRGREPWKEFCKLSTLFCTRTKQKKKEGLDSKGLPNPTVRRKGLYKGLDSPRPFSRVHDKVRQTTETHR